MNRIYRFIIPILAYSIVVVIVFFPVLYPSSGKLLFGNDIFRSYHYFRMFARQSLYSGIIPWWNPYLFSGAPFIANPSVSFWYPPNWLFFIFHHRDVYALLIPLHILLAMTGMYWLCRRWMAGIPAWVAGLTFGLSGYFMARVWEGHIDIITSAPFLPIVFGMFWKAMEKPTRRAIAFASLVYAIQIYAGYQTIALFTGWAIGLAAFFISLRQRSVRPVVTVLTGLFLTVGLAALQLLPAQEFFRHSFRTYPLPYSWAVMGSLAVTNLKQFIAPFVLGDQYTYQGVRPNYGELVGYIGKVPLGLAILFVIFMFATLRRSRFPQKTSVTPAVIWVFFVLSVLAIWVSMGWYAPIDLNHALWQTIPFYRYLRIPARHLILFVFGMSALAGFGFAKVRNQMIQVLLIVAILADLLPYARHFIEVKNEPESSHDSKLVALFSPPRCRNSFTSGVVDAGCELSRVLPNFNVGMGTRDALDFDAAMAYPFFSASGYDPSILKNYYEFIAAASGTTKPDVQQSDVQVPYLNVHTFYADMLNIKYVLVPSWFDSVGGSSERFPLVLDDPKTYFWRLYENKTVMPRFFLVPKVVILPDRDAVALAISKQSYNPKTTVLVDQSSASMNFLGDCGTGEGGMVVVTSYAASRIALSVESPCNAFLTSSEVMYPGWDATVDGVKTNLFEGNLAFRTMIVPRGNHTIIMEYKPRIFLIGGLISFLTAMGMIVWVRFESVKYKNNS